MNAKESIVFMLNVHIPHAQAILQSHSPPQVALTDFNFFNPGEVGGGGTSAGRLEKCKVYRK